MPRAMTVVPLRTPEVATRKKGTEKLKKLCKKYVAYGRDFEITS